MRRNLVVTGLTGLLLAHLSVCAAQSGVEIDISRVELQAQAGGSVSTSLNVRHPGEADSKPMTVRPYLRDFLLPVQGTQTYAAPGSNPNSLGKWLQVTPTTFKIDPGKTQMVRYTVNVPPGTPPGLYWGALFFEAKADENAQKAGTTSVRYQVDVGQIIYVQVGAGKFGGRLTGIEAALSGKTLNVAATISNDGTTLIRAAGRAQIRDSSGKVLATVPIGESVALPGNRRTFSGEGNLDLPAGHYDVLVAMQYAPGKFFTGQTALDVKAP